MAYLDHYLKAGKRRSRTVERKAHLITKAMDIMDDWRLTPFEYEGACRASMRSALCLSGSPWDHADAEAAEIVRQALAGMGAERPDWDEGQPELLTPRDECAWCHGPIEDDPDQVRRFCSVECARASILRRNEEGNYRETLIGRSAFKLVDRSTKRPRKCAQCGKEFRPVHNGKDQRYCSRTCVDLSLQTGGFNHQCVECGISFNTRLSRSKFCSHKCVGQHQKKRTSARFLVRCEWCGSHFIGKSGNATFCSNAHKLAKSRHMRGVSKALPPEKSNVIDLSTVIFDRMFGSADLLTRKNVFDGNVFDRLFG